MESEIRSFTNYMFIMTCINFEHAFRIERLNCDHLENNESY